MEKCSGPGRDVTRCPGAALIRRGAARRSPWRLPSGKHGVSASAIGHVNAHGSGSKVGDLAEARAVHRVFGASPPPVTALKGYMGTLASGCGSVELIGSLIGVNRGLIPATLNCDQPDPLCDLDVVHGEARPSRSPIFVNTNITPNGQAAALVVRGNPSSAGG